MTSRSYLLGIAAAALAAVGMTASAADADVKCQRAIAKGSAQYVQARAKSLGKCEVSKVSGKLPLATDCHTEEKTQAALAKQLTKLTSTIDKACGGADKVCGGIDDQLAVDNGWPATCPNFEDGACNNAIGPGCGGIATCLACIDDAAVDQSIALYADDLNVESPIVDKTLNKCQQSVIKSTQAYLNSRSKALQKCWDARMNGKHTMPCPDPGDGKAVAAIAKAETKKVAAICKACGGPDKLCDGIDDLSPATIGFVSQCTDVTPVGATTCDAAVSTLDNLVDCVDCVTDFKTDCPDRAAVPQFGALPAVCNPSPAGTPTPTQTPCPTPTAPFPACPSQIQIDTIQASSELDTGWTGVSHDNKIPDGNRVTVSVSGCAGTNLPTCGQCTISGPVENAGGPAFTNRRCGSSSSWKSCTSNADCVGEPGSPPCAYFFGPPLPLSNGAVPVCVTNEVTGSLTGTANIDDGSSSSNVSLISRVHTGLTVDLPCPSCERRCSTTLQVCTQDSDCPGIETCLTSSRICGAGPRVNQPCTIQGTSVFFENTTLDCPPGADGDAIGTVPVTLNLSTGTQTRTLSAANPACRAPGYTGLKCQCDTCQTAAAEPCSADTDCPVGRTCGGRRCLPGSPSPGDVCVVNADCGLGGTCGVPGQNTATNACAANDCMPNGSDTGSSDEGICQTGPADQLCSFDRYRGCMDDSECRTPGEGGSCGACTPVMQSCISELRQCFTDNGAIGDDVTATGSPEAPCGNVAQPQLATLFCVKQTNSGSVNAVAGLPGLGRLTIKSTTTMLP